MVSNGLACPAYLAGPVLVTGGAGFIGTHLITALLGRGAKVINLDIRPPTLAEHQPYWSKCDLMDHDGVSALIARERPVLVYNLAAHARLDGTAEDMRVNVQGLEVLLSALAQLEHEPLLVHASTMVVAGPNRDTFDPESYEPQFGLYAQSKVQSEKLLRAQSRQKRWTIVRPSVIWGPYHSTFPNQVWRYIRLRLYMHPSGFDALRSYGYVGNVVHQLMRIAEIDPTLVEGRTLYAGDEPLMSTLWLDAFSRALTGKPVRRVPGWLLRIAASAGELSGSLGGPSPINNGRLTRMTTDFPIPMGPTFALLGNPPFSLEEGVRTTAEWLHRRRG